MHLISSDFEGSPNSVKECLACNTKVVSTPVGNIEDLIGDIQGCFISKSFEPEELANLVIEALKTPTSDLHKRIIKKQLDINSIAKKLLKIYN